jgi:2-polyprenyl-3-methyl-5-hydroxy-6-metoxy-1,4-benzoquinol methylase
MEHENCPICNSKRIRKLKKYEKYFLVKCNTCSFIYSYKIPENKELDIHYMHYGHYSYISPITLKRYDELLLTFEKYKKTNKILDFGCGSGYFLERAKIYGWDVYGIESGTDAIATCLKKGINMLNTDEINNQDLIKFDIIFSSEVIEHLSFPVSYLKMLSELIRHGGLLYITTPNFKCISRIFMKSKWTVLGYPEHLSYFTSRTLKKALRNNNFKILNIHTHGLSISRLKLSVKKKKETAVYKNTEDEKIREITENSKIMNIIKSIINGLLSFLKMGDTIKCYAIKISLKPKHQDTLQ